MAELAADFNTALQDLLSLLHQIALQQLVPNIKPDEAYDESRLQPLVEQLSPEDVQLYYQIGLTGQKELSLAPDPRSGFEMVLLRMLAFKPADDQVQAGPSEPPAASRRQAPAAPRPPQKKTVEQKSVGSDQRSSSSKPDPSQWDAFAASLKLGGITSQLANNCAFHSWDGETLRLQLDPAKQQLRVGQSEKRLLDGIRERLGDQVKLQILVEQGEVETPAKRQARAQSERQQQAEQSFTNDPFVRELQEHFDARLVSDSIKPVD
jgi:DNA polymerase-3 subunit gamma/tau